MSLVAEIEARHASFQNTEQGRSTQAFLLGGREEAVDTFEGMPSGFKYLNETQRQQFVMEMLVQQLRAGEQRLQVTEQQLKADEQQLHDRRVALKRKRCSDLVETYKSLRDLGAELDDRILIELRDNVTILERQDVAVNAAVAIATPLIQDSTTPTHSLGSAERGQETGIVVVSSKIGIRVPQPMSGTVGKRMKALYIKKYSLPVHWNAFIKRQTLFNGRPILENVYYERDEDVIEQAIRDIMRT